MARPDPVRVLARLRGIACDAARRDLADAQRNLAAAEQAGERMALALAREAASASPEAFAAWLPAARRDRDRALAAADRASVQVATARQDLVLARAEAEAVAALLEARQLARRRARLAAEQRLLDDLPR